MRKLLTLFSLSVFILSSCGTFEISFDVTATPDPVALVMETPIASPILSMQSSSSEIQQFMLTSATRWQTVWIDGTIKWYAPDGSGATQTYREQAWVDQPTSRFRTLLSAMNAETPETLKACDGETILEYNIVSGKSQSGSLPKFARAGNSEPTMLWGQIGTPLTELVYAQNLGGNGEFKAVGAEVVAGREAVIVEFKNINETFISFRAWLDVKTAVILKLQDFNESGMTGERAINQIVYNAVFDAALFGIPSAPPQFDGIAGTAANAQITESAAPSRDDSLGQLYFFTLPHQAGQSVQLVRLPGSCAVGVSPCPQLEIVQAPFPFNFTLTALSWSNDGKFAAFAYPDNANGSPTKLWLFEPETNKWTALAEFPYIDPPFWSADGNWIAFRVQDGKGGEDVYAIRRDGTELKNLTASGSLPADGRPYVMDGWLTENIIVRSALPGKEGVVYLLRVSDGTARPMFDTLITKAVFVVSPDSAWLAYDDYDYDGRKHSIRIMEPDGANAVEIAFFAGGNVFPIRWSPDGTRLAFSHSSVVDANNNPVSDVYVINRDGRGMTQVYKGMTVGNILFSPDGKYLIVEETTSATGGHLFAINLDTLEQKIISAPGLSLDTDWYAPSWKP